MRLTERDKQIIRSVERFRALNRNQIIDIYFKDKKDKERSANIVLNRLKKNGYLRVDDTCLPYVYLPRKGGSKKGSQKTHHFLEIANVYIELQKTSNLKEQSFTPEIKLGGKGTVEPDALITFYRGWPWFLEVQLSIYSSNIMERKLKRYEAYFKSNEWKKLHWQPKTKKPVFPLVWIIGERKYNVSRLTDLGIEVFQTESVGDLIDI